MANTDCEFDLGLGGMKPVPIGSLILVAHFDPQVRDEILSKLKFNLCIYLRRVIYFSVSEAEGVAENRYVRWKQELFSRRARGEAAQKLPEPAYVSGQTSEQRQQAVEVNHEKRELHAQKLFNKISKSYLETEILSFVALSRASVGAIDEWIEEDLEPDLPEVLIVDDLSAFRRENGKAGGAKLCGEHARVLKDLAVDRGFLVIAGMPAPCPLEKRDFWVHKKLEVEAPLDPLDLGAYGAPQECADGILTRVLRYDGSGSLSGSEIVAIQARYGVAE